ncbi:MAG: hypothetical protein CXT73_02335 [Methanobacteriota archaeon]|nr:MAG: hypothetical protein CXT73_02335 [Euryarchaeota archaeon]
MPIDPGYDSGYDSSEIPDIPYAPRQRMNTPEAEVHRGVGWNRWDLQRKRRAKGRKFGYLQPDDVIERSEFDTPCCTSCDKSWCATLTCRRGPIKCTACSENLTDNGYVLEASKHVVQQNQKCHTRQPPPFIMDPRAIGARMGGIRRKRNRKKRTKRRTRGKKRRKSRRRKTRKKRGGKMLPIYHLKLPWNNGDLEEVSIEQSNYYMIQEYNDDGTTSKYDTGEEKNYPVWIQKMVVRRDSYGNSLYSLTVKKIHINPPDEGLANPFQGAFFNLPCRNMRILGLYAPETKPEATIDEKKMPPSEKAASMGRTLKFEGGRRKTRKKRGGKEVKLEINSPEELDKKLKLWKGQNYKFTWNLLWEQPPYAIKNLTYDTYKPHPTPSVQNPTFIFKRPIDYRGDRNVYLYWDYLVSSEPQNDWIKEELILNDPTPGAPDVKLIFPFVLRDDMVGGSKKKKHKTRRKKRRKSMRRKRNRKKEPKKGTEKRELKEEPARRNQ